MDKINEEIITLTKAINDSKYWVEFYENKCWLAEPGVDRQSMNELMLWRSQLKRYTELLENLNEK